MINKKDYAHYTRYIKSHWRHLSTKTVNDKKLLIGLPNTYVCPSREEFEKKMYYWDSYFIILGLLCNKKIDLARGMAENLFYLFRKFEFIPQSNRYYHLGKSNPPLLTSIIDEIVSVTKDRAWLRGALKVAIGEYEKIWTRGYRLTSTRLSRYWEPSHTHEQAEDESGWDRTTRFQDECLNVNPIDLNSLLYKYETDISRFFTMLNNREKSRIWVAKAASRKRLINRYMWDEKRGFFFDYNYIKNRKMPVWSLAGFFPIWTGVANKNQALKLVRNLRHFECAGGLVTTRKRYVKGTSYQWDYPIGWACLHWIVVKGLLDYGFSNDAIRISEKWLQTCTGVFDKTGKFWEKYNVVRPGVGKVGRYPTQSGFGWTNGVYLKLLDIW